MGAKMGTFSKHNLHEGREERMQGECDAFHVESSANGQKSEMMGTSRESPIIIEIEDEEDSSQLNGNHSFHILGELKCRNPSNNNYTTRYGQRDVNANIQVSSANKHATPVDVIIVDDDTETDASNLNTETEDDENSLLSKENPGLSRSNSENVSNNKSVDTDASSIENSKRESKFHCSSRAHDCHVAFCEDCHISAIKQKKNWQQTQNSDWSDCEVMDENDEEVRQRWEAASRKKWMMKAMKQRYSEAGVCSSSMMQTHSYREGFSETGNTFQHTSSEEIIEEDLGNYSSDARGIDSCVIPTKHQHNNAKETANLSFQKEACLQATETITESAPIDNPDKVICSREQLKETVEFQHADEEEWRNRQLELERQAKEAQLLRKRKRAEAERLMEMERRQKLRIEEIRETQKKEEQTMDLKEQFRTQIRKNLEEITSSCKDMPSLLRCLGVAVEGGLFPSQQQVNAAYKRALFRYHPDRASTVKHDLWHQVEAEETFKLISRLKDLLTNSSITYHGGV